MPDSVLVNRDYNMVNCQNSQLADALDAELATFARRAPGLRHVTTIT